MEEESLNEKEIDYISNKQDTHIENDSSTKGIEEENGSYISGYDKVNAQIDTIVDESERNEVKDTEIDFDQEQESEDIGTT
ncbi:MAG: hypothetical protein EZS28_043623 [Streblomastix strix]|uniref:Uncharacterized protein n=1 Tax=Streblomastix strix TaxID=222440 RepID=A0A5J4TS98_9EUKA|nr:MAG: hypothetical protein EZS28_043623 [Streblomastix strix]